MANLYKIAAAYGVSVDWLRQEMARGVDWSTAVDPSYRQWRQAEIDEQNRKFQAELAAQRTPEAIAARAEQQRRQGFISLS